MSQPTPYSRHYNFTDWQAVNPTRPLPATQLEVELNNVKLTTDGVLENLAKIQRDDGKLANQLVTPEALSAGSLAMIGTGEFNPMGAWVAATVYSVNDLVEYNQATYLCLVSHTAAIAFPTDLAAHKWLMLANGALTGSAATVDLFVGNGSQTVFTLSVSYADSNSAQVFVNGVIQIPVQDFTISGTTLTMVTAPPAPTVGGRKTLMVRGNAVEVQLAVTAAQLSEANAAGYAAAAQASEDAAALSEAAAATSFTNFDKRYLGSKAGDPTLDNQGAALTAGALYFNTSSNVMKLYSGSSWGVAYVPVNGALMAANNLSDVANAATARANLGAAAALPAQTGNSGKVLKTDGSNVSWSDAQTGDAFSAYAVGGGTSVSNGTWTKIALAAEEFDTNNTFDSTTNYRFKPTVPGYYLLTGVVSVGGSYSGNLAAIYKNGSAFKMGNGLSSNYGAYYVGVTALVYFNGTTDYVELYLHQNSGSSITTAVGLNSTYFQGFLARAQ